MTRTTDDGEDQSEEQRKEMPMPFINVKMLAGRSEEQKRELVKAITDAMVNICGAKPEGTTVLIEDVAKEDWAKGGILMSDQ